MNIQNRNSRQAYTIGKEALNKMFNKSIMIDGMTSIGISIAKMVIQNGAKQITLYDSNEKITKQDLRSFFFKNSEINMNKKDILLNRLQKLNPYVNITYIEKSCKIDNLTCIYDVAIFCDKNIFDLIPYNELCRKIGIKFISANVFGLFGCVFSDFGNEFNTYNPNGVELSSGIIIKFYDVLTIKDYTGNKIKYKNVVELDKSKIHTLQKKDKIKILVNGKDITNRLYSVNSIINSYMFTLKKCKCLKIGNIRNTEFIQYRESVKMNHNSLYDCLTIIKNNKFEMTNMVDFDRPKHLSAIHKAIDMTELYNNDTDMYIWNDKYTNHMINKVHVIDPTVPINLIRKIIYTLKGNLPMFDSVISGFAGNEALKACSEKFTPFNQFFYKDECQLFPLEDNMLPFNGDNSNYLPSYNYYPKTNSLGLQTRYDGMIIVLGRNNVDKIRKSNVFIVGSGAIGCELLMNLSLMGVKRMVITDVDTIEQSNLNRQALFDDNDIGKFKSDIAVIKGREMNNDIEYDSRKNYISQDTENIYDTKFYKEITCVFPAVDNIEARRYLDSKCISNNIPMIDAGTQGTTCSVQPIIPNITINYSSTNDENKNEQYPMCTVKNFPYRPEHLVQWSKNIFNELFIEPFNILEKIKRDKNILNKNDEIEYIYNILESFIPYKSQSDSINKYENCIRYLYFIWNDYFVKQIIKITDENPENSVDSEGNLFWSGVKRFPQYQLFDINNDLHLDFIIYGSIIRANMIGIESNKIINYSNRDEYKKIINNINKNICNKNIISNNDKKKYIEEIINSNISLNYNEFEKDNDDNNHIDFITCCTNMRAYNYKMALLDRFIVKKIAGKIIPAINTTTTVVSGIACIEFCKYVIGKNKIEHYYSTFSEMARNSFQQFEPQIPNKFKIKNKEYNLWTIDTITSNFTLIDLLERYDDVEMTHYNMGKIKIEVIDISSINGTIFDKIYNDDDDDDDDDNIDSKLEDILKENGDDTNNDIHLNIVLNAVEYCNKHNPTNEELDKLKNFEPISIHVIVKI